ncbi:peroxiredoxin [Candidatus Gracilibacteria bacterium]|nr:peroxiredoxin [Candidatus Gracilibacteria bacterium]
MDSIFKKEFEILSLGNQKNTSLESILQKNSKVLLYFYPKDNTPGCSLENKDFSCLKDEFEKIGIKLIGVSKDSIDSHKKFVSNYNLENDLISDENLELHKYFKAYGEKNNYGKLILGVIRSSFLIDNNFNILKSWKNIKAKNHAQKVLDELKSN